MSEYSWDNPKLQLICGQCHLKDKDPKLCHGVEPPIEKNIYSNRYKPMFVYSRIILAACSTGAEG